MAFTPPACPQDDCPSHRPGVRFSWRRNGTFERASDGASIQRYLCTACERGFSEQTFRADYRLRLRGLAEALAPLLVSKVTHRQSARLLGVDRKTVQRRVALLGGVARRAQEALLCRSRAEALLDGGFALDELETYVGSRLDNPWTVAVLVHKRSACCLFAAGGPLPRRKGRRASQADRPPLPDEVRRWRSGGSRIAVTGCALALRALVPAGATVVLQTDCKRSYGPIFRRHFGRRLVHQRTSSKAKRDTRNPLFQVNLTFAMLRDGVSRLVRETWAAAKDSERLLDHATVWMLYRNFVRGFSNASWWETPAMRLGICQRRLGWGELLRWRAPFVGDLLRA